LLFAVSVAHATETDQFTPPKAALKDIGPELSRKVVEIIEADRTGGDPEQILAKWAGHNLFASRPAMLVKKSGFRPNVFGSIYRLAFSPVPAAFLFDSPTVNLHGHHVGSDKIDHFFRQGHEYFEMTVEMGTSAEAVARGVKHEHAQLGTLASGVYSNADLAANYAGMKFYLNVRQPVRIGERILPPLFEKSGEGWRLREGIDRDLLLEPFISDHLDESLNPSRYRFSRESIRARVRGRCEEWKRFYADRLGLVAPAGESFASTWFGEEYGHWLPPTDEVSIATECPVVSAR
jgi:hypothetical protein